MHRLFLVSPLPTATSSTVLGDKEAPTMHMPIGRSPEISEDRIFPPITPDLYRTEGSLDLVAEQIVAYEVLTLRHAPLDWWQKTLGLGLDETGQASVLLNLHSLAFDAELNGQWNKADFFWKQAIVTLQSLCKKDGFWETFAAKLSSQANTAVITRLALRQRLVEEIFVDTHCAFYNGYLAESEALTLNNRAFAHFGYLVTLADFLQLPLEHQKTLLRPPLEAQVKLNQEANNFWMAIRAGQHLLRLFPQRPDYQTELAQLYLADTLARLSNRESSSGSLRDANRLQQGIKQIEKLREKYPYNITNFQLLGLLHHLRAVKLGNSGRISEALVSAKKATVCYPGLMDAQTTLVKLVEAMKQLQAQMSSIEAQVASNSRARLNSKGRKLRSEARRGVSPMLAYARSDDATETSRAYQVAQSRRTWEQIGLSQPSENWDEQAVALVEAMSQIINEPPETEEDVPVAWEEVRASNPTLALIDPVPIHRFLKQRIFEGREPEAEVRAKTDPDVVPKNPPLLTSVASEKQRSRAPFGYWLFSRQNMAFKFVTLILIVGLGWFTIQSTLDRQTRNTAYAQVEQCFEDKNYSCVMDGVESFMASLPLIGNDPRQQAILDFQQDVSAAQARDSAYDKMVETYNQEDYEGSLVAIQSFLDHPPRNGQDERYQEVLSFQLSAQYTLASQARDQAYEHIVEAYTTGDYQAILNAVTNFLNNPPHAGQDPRRQDVLDYQQDAQNGIEREEAYVQAINAFADKDYPDVLDGAQAFLENLPLLGSVDEREPEILVLQQQALAGQEAKEQSYEQIASAADIQDLLSLIEGAEVYLQHTALDSSEDRDVEVVELYSVAFVRWFTHLEGQPDEVALTHVDRYRELMIDADRQESK